MANPPKKEGASHEARFTAEALARGFDVLEPVGDYLPYDRVAVNSGGESFRVQVKGTRYKQKGKQSYNIMAATGNDVKTIISPEEVDVLAAYVVPADAWYLIPADKLTSKSVYLSPLDNSSVGKYETFRDAWNVFA